ncbi:MAG: hypothetical protein JNL79_02005 [Myxococcales bacterium]|nr:hypothetical protein [Myxococcales bacterium]
MAEDEEIPPLDARADAELSRTAPPWDAGGKSLSLAYWGAILLLVGGLFRTRLLPLVDYPQHLALAGTLRRMMASGAPERALFETNLLSYNSAFHVLVAGLGLVVPIDTAGRLVVSGYMVLLGFAALALCRATGRPRARAFLVLPVFVGYTFAWGFINFGLGAAVQMLVLARVLARQEGQVPAEKRLRFDLLTALLATVGAWTHLLASALVYMLMLVAIVAKVQVSREGLFARLGRALRIGAPLLPAVAFCAWVYRRQQRLAWQNFEYGAYEGNDVFAMQKVKGFLGYGAGLRADMLDQKILGVGLGLLLLAALFRDPDDEAPAQLRWMFVASLVAYFVIPHVFWATNFVFERLTFFIVITAALFAPRAMPEKEELVRLMSVSVGLGAAASFFLFMGAVRTEMADLDAILDAMPKGRRITGLVWHPKIEATEQWSLLHSPAYYVARNGGEVAFSFTRTMSLPVHYKREMMPPDPPANFEWNPSDYRPGMAFAKYFDLVLMKTTYDDGKDPRASVWGTHANEVDVVLHRGKWWVFETKRVKDDPPPTFTFPDDEPEAPEQHDH